VFLDYKRNREKNRLKTLNDSLSCTNLSSEIKQVQALDSRHSQFIQIADLLTGAVAYRYHETMASTAKTELVERIEGFLSRDKLKATGVSEQKFNVFQIDLSGGRW
jgi:hypothetical protein